MVIKLKKLFNPKLTTTFPCGINPKTPYPPPPSISFSRMGEIPAIVLPITSLSFPPIHFLFPFDPHTSTPPFISSLCELGSPQLNAQSPFGLLFAHKSRGARPNFRYIVCLLFVHGSSSFRFDSHSLVRLLSLHMLGSSRFNFRSPLYVTST